MTLICPVLNLISMFQNLLQKHSTEPNKGGVNGKMLRLSEKSVSFCAITTFTCILFIIMYRTSKRTLKFLWNSDKTF